MSIETTAIRDREIFGPLELPSGKKVKFKEPRGIDRVNVIQALKMGMDNTAGSMLLIDTYVALKCVTEHDGKNEIGNFQKLVAEMPQEDVDYYQAVFQQMFGMTDEKRDAAKEDARFLRSKRICTDSSS